MARCQRANLCCVFFRKEESRQRKTLGILAFDAAKTMCRLLSLYKSLTDAEIIKLRRHVIRSKGVAYLNSKEECFLLNLACAERLEDLNLAAATVSCLSHNCYDQELTHFDTLYGDMKRGRVDIQKLEFGTQNIDKIIGKMEKLVSHTRNLHKAMESLVEMEDAEKKIERWKMRTMRTNHGMKLKVECYNDRIVYHRKQLQYYKQVSLWNQTFDKVVRLMSRIIYIVYARIQFVFGALVTGVPRFNKNNNVEGFLRPNLKNSSCLLKHRELYVINICLFCQNEEPLQKKRVFKSTRSGVIRFHNCRHPPRVVAIHGGDGGGEGLKYTRVLNLAPPSTVGGAGLSMRYASVILFLERCLHATATAIGDDARAALYEMLPARLKAKVRGALRAKWLEWVKNSNGSFREERRLARWQEAVEEVMEWLAPVAHDTVRWQAERNLEMQKFETKPTVLLLQTLHYSDLEKVEGAIVEVLMGLSCIYWCQRQP